VTRRLQGENCANRGKHRTEDTEVTEGDQRIREEALLTRQLQGENCANRGKHRTEDTEVTEGKPEDRGLGLVTWLSALSPTAGSKEGIPRSQAAPQRVAKSLKK
jgi:hypothetical protein